MKPQGPDGPLFVNASPVPAGDAAGRAGSPPVLPVGPARRLRASDSRAPSRPRLGLRGDIEFHARGLGPLLFQPEGRHGAGALRVLPAEGPVRRLRAEGRSRGGGSRHGLHLRSARRVPAQRGNHTPRRDRRPLRKIRALESAPGRGRLVRGRKEASPARLSSCRRHRDLGARCRIARHPDHAAASLARRAADPLPRGRPGRRRGRRDRAGHRRRPAPPATSMS